MKVIGIICEYNPFHLGHQKQIDLIRNNSSGETAIVCLMSGNFVQRGMPAIFDKAIRARAALECGADLVLELPVTYALSSAEGFAAGGVRILSGFCDELSFGTESAGKEQILQTAEVLLSDAFSEALRQHLDRGISFPAARQKALESLGCDGSMLNLPNNILGVEYCKAILSQNSSMMPAPIHREGNYHNTAVDADNPSATAVRALIHSKHDFQSCIPAAARTMFADAPRYDMEAGQKAILYRLRTMSDEEFKTLPYGSEGLWRKLMHASRSCATLEDIIAATKSKRYTRTRIDRMIMCATLGITARMLEESAPYTRVLAFNETGRQVLKKARLTGHFPHIGESTGHEFEVLERRCDDLYGLFRVDMPDSAGVFSKRRLFIK